MLFSSPAFLFAFFPAVFLLHLLLKNTTARNILLLVASLIFYAGGEPVFVVLMVASVFINHLLARGIARLAQAEGQPSKAPKKQRIAVAAAIALNLLFLGFFKYARFAVESLNAVFGASIPVPQIALPVGISFFTFQMLSYVIDIYRQPEMVQRRFYKVLLYIAFFPQLLAGPIVKYHDIAEQIDHRSVTAQGVASGMMRFSIGLAKKVLIANAVGMVADGVFALSPALLSAPTAWLGALAYCLQIYFDFSGYSDMAIGLGRTFGFEFKENFQYPFTACGLKDFWRRWHISLSTWFREYLYIPLGGNRKGSARTGINMAIVFLCTGLWHGAQWTFVIWGIWHGLFLLLENYRVIRPSRVWGRVYTLLVVTLGFVVFRAETFAQAGAMLSGMFTGFAVTPAQWTQFLALLSPFFIAMFSLGVVASTPVLPWMTQRLEARGRVSLGHGLAVACSLALLVISALATSASAYNPFLYYRF